MPDEKSEQTEAAGTGAVKLGAAVPASSSKSWGKAVVPLALALGAAAIVYTLVTPERAAEPAKVAADAGADCPGMLLSIQNALARHELVSARESAARAPSECRLQQEWLGSEAELLVLEGQVAQGKELASQVAKAEPKPLSARRVECLWLLQAAEHTRSVQCFDKLLPGAPDDLGTVFHAARAAQHAGRYRAAREGYLKALRLEPKHVEARYRLALMTHSIGANAEAMNHLRKLGLIARADDPRLAQARQALAADAKSTAPSAASANR